MPEIIQARQLTKVVSDGEAPLTILDNVSLDIAAGATVAIVGASGSGKSTLLGLLAGLDLPSSGTVMLDGIELTALDEDGRAAARAGRVGFVFQSFQLLPGMTALENVMLPLELAGQDNAGERARRILERVGLSERQGHYPAQLSGGEQQRVALARAFVTGPRVLFADEPTGSLDQLTGERITDLLFDLNRELGTTLILVTHDSQLAARCQQRVPLERGRVRDAG